MCFTILLKNGLVQTRRKIKTDLYFTSAEHTDIHTMLTCVSSVIPLPHSVITNITQWPTV